MPRLKFRMEDHFTEISEIHQMKEEFNLLYDIPEGTEGRYRGSRLLST